jgi:hypothetical protein
MHKSMFARILICSMSLAISALGQITTKSVLRINESGEWTELAEIKALQPTT